MSRLKIKFWGSEKACENFKRFLDQNFMAVLRPTKPSDEGGAHGFATIEVREEVIQSGRYT